MNILVINGSPKGNYSTTLQTALWLQLRFPEHNFEFITAGQRVKAWEKDFSPALDAIRRSDVLIFCYPVYTFIAPSQLHRFIELMKASGEDFTNKIATQLTTSKHFYDITAHRFIEDNCADMGIAFIDGLSADMDDLLHVKGQREAEQWFRFVLWNIGQGIFKAPSAVPTDSTHAQASQPVQEAIHTSDKRVVIVSDCADNDVALRSMIDRFRDILPCASDEVNIHAFPFSGGCISCFNCSTSGQCFYKDGFSTLLRDNIHQHDAIVYAFRIQDHSMGYRFKVYDDRQFCNGHRTVTMGTPFGYLIDGNYSCEENLRLILEARAQVGGNVLSGVATNEGDVDAAIDRLAATLTWQLAEGYTQPQNFLGVGGMKIFRDLIYLMRGLMKEDHRFFRSHGQYDFPQKQRATTLKMYLVGWLMGNKKIKSKMGNKMNEGMIAPYRKVLAKAKPEVLIPQQSSSNKATKEE